MEIVESKDDALRTLALVLTGAIEDTDSGTVIDFGKINGAQLVSLTPGYYRFIGETHSLSPAGMSAPMDRCDRTFIVLAGELTTLTVKIDWDEGCWVAVR